MIAFLSPKQFKIEESSIESMAKQLEAHLHEEPKLWSSIVLCQNQIMNARRESKERNLTWRIQEDRNCWTHLEYLIEFISCILYVTSKLGKSAIQSFQQCMNWSWNKEVIAIGSQSHQAEGQFRNYEITRYKLRNQPLAEKWRLSAYEISQPILHACEIHLSASRYLRLTLLDFFFRYLLFKSPFSSCNPPIIGFLS